MTYNSLSVSIQHSFLPQFNKNVTVLYPQLVNSSFVIELVLSIYNIYHFRNFIFYITERLDIESDVVMDFFNNFWKVIPLGANIIIRKAERDYPMEGFISTPSLILIFTTEKSDPIMNLAASSLRGVRILKTIFILFPILTNGAYYGNIQSFTIFWEIVRTTYEWIWKQQFLNTILITIDNNLFVLDPYPTTKIINKTGQWQAPDFFKYMSTNLKGFVIDTVIRYDLPRVFQKQYIKSNQRQVIQISGTSGYLFTEFVKSVNGVLNDTTYLDTQLEPVDMNQIFSLIREDTIDVSLHSYTAMPGFNVGSSYPIGINDWCIMVPYKDNSPEQIYLQSIFQDNTWILIGFSFVYISLGVWICSKTESRDFSTALLQSLCSLLAIVPTSIFNAPTVRMRFMYFMLFVLGFIVSNMFVSKLYSYLTSSPKQQQINTIEDVIAENLHIMIIDAEYYMLKAMPNIFPTQFLQLVQIVSKYEMDIHRNHFNTSFGYSVQSDRWRFLNMEQKNLRKPLFRLSKICNGPYYHVFPMRIDSHLNKPLKYFIMYASQSGFLEYWVQKSFYDALHMKLVNMLTISEQIKPLSLRFFISVWVVWWFGMIVSGFILIIEIKWVNRPRF